MLKKQWRKQIKGNKNLGEMKCGLRKFVEMEINEIDLSMYEDRPLEKLNLSLGDPTLSPCFRTDKTNLEIASLNANQEKCCASQFQGSLGARVELSTKYRAKSYSITENDVYIVAGGGSSLHLIANLLANPGDNFLFPTPGFPLLLSVAKALSLEVRFYSLKAEQNWEADIKEMDALIDSRTKFIVVNDPSNPLGSCWSNEFKLSILELCRRRNIPLLADEIYETISCDQSLQTFAELSPSNDITIFKASGLTKKYSIPGWRIGWIIVYAEAQLQRFYGKYMKNLLNIFAKPNIIAERSICEIVRNSFNDQSLKRKIELIQRNLDILNQTLQELGDYFEVTKSAGAIYASIRVKLSNFNRQLLTVLDFSKLLYAEENILIIPGIFFGSDSPFIRLLIACDEGKMKEFCTRSRRFCQKYGL